jgi:hypothetical protein
MLERVEQVFRRKPLHGRRSVRSICCRGAHVALAAPLYLIEDNSGNDNQEHATQSAAERYEDHYPVRVVTACARVSICE